MRNVMPLIVAALLALLGLLVVNEALFQLIQLTHGKWFSFVGDILNIVRNIAWIGWFVLAALLYEPAVRWCERFAPTR